MLCVMSKLKEIRAILGLSQSQMAEILGIGQTGVSQIETGKTSLSDRNKRTLIEKFSITPDFFDDDTPKGMSFEIDASNLVNIKKPSIKAKSLGAAERLSMIIEGSGLTIEEYATSIDIPPNEIEDVIEGVKEMSIGLLNSIGNKYENVSLEWIITGSGTSSKMNQKPQVETRPRIPYTAAAGTLGTIALEGVTNGSCEHIPVVKTFPKYDYTIIVKGDSMEPEYRAGDEIACLGLKDSRFLQWGKVHVLDTTQGIVIKRIYDADDCIKCSSRNPDYPDFLIPKEEIYSLGLVVGLLRL